MKKFSWKIAARIFLSIILFDVVLLVLNTVVPDSYLTIIPWWIVNFPGFPLIYLLRDPNALALFMMGVGLFSALIWSVVAGFIFRHKMNI